MAQTATKKDSALLHSALENFRIATAKTKDFTKSAIEDLNFIAGDQKPAQADLFFQVNLIPPFLRQITADAREANPSIEVVPVSGNDQELASAYEGIIRCIEEKSDASTAYETALWYAAACGVGYIFLDSQFVGPDTFDQELVIKTCDNPFKVVLDPNAEHLDGSDAEYGFIIEDFAHDQFKRKFPKSVLAKKVGQSGGWKQLSLPNDWMTEDTIRVAKYFVKEYDEKTLYSYQHPLSLETKVNEIAPDVFIGTEEMPGEGSEYKFLRKRKVFDVKVKSYVLTAYEVLDETESVFGSIPIIRVPGDTYTVGGKRITHGAVRFAKDPQKQFNFHLTRKTELIDLIPKVPFIAANGQVIDNPDLWANAHRIPVGTLTYSPISVEGQLVPPPQRPQGIDAAAFGAVSSAQAESLEHLKLVFGMHGNPAMDDASNDTSGVALDIRNTSAGKSQYIFFDHLLGGLRRIGRLFIAAIPKVYDTDRKLRILKPDGQDAIIAINSMENNNRYDLSQGSYDVRVKTGPAYTTRREKSLNVATTILPLLPEAQRAVTSDLVLRLVDDPIAQRMADRVKATQPQEVLASTGDADENDLAPMELVKQLQASLSNAQGQLKMKDLENQELQVRVKVAEDKSALELTKADMENEQKLRELEHQDNVAEVESRLTMKKLELEERKIDLEEQKLEIARIQAASGVLDTMKPAPPSDLPDTKSIGGKL